MIALFIALLALRLRHPGKPRPISRYNVFASYRMKKGSTPPEIRAGNRAKKPADPGSSSSSNDGKMAALPRATR